MLDRRLDKNEVVHHINLDKSDNDPDNPDVLDGHDSHQDAHRSLYGLFPKLIKSGYLRYDLGAHRYEAGVK